MFSSNLIKTGVAVTATTALLAGGPALARVVGLADPAPAAMPVAWESTKLVDSQQMADSNEVVVAAEQARRAKAKKRAQAARKAAEERRRAEAKAARTRAAQGGTPGQNRALGMQMCRDRGWSGSQCEDLGRLWQKESGWNHRAHNGSSGAHGIPQALPGSKMGSHGSDWATSPRTQIAWGLDYIAGRYGNPSSAWAHSMNRGWY